MYGYFNIGFIGGSINSAVGTVHKIASQMDGKFKLVAGCFSRNPDINIATGDKWGIEPNRIYNNWQQLLENEKGNIDAVVILTPTPDHGNIIEKALECQYSVISEKALVESVYEATKIKNLLTSHNGFLTVTYNYTGYPVVRELKKIINSGQLGKINQVLVEMPQEGFIKVGKDDKPVVPQSWRLKDYEIPTLSLDLGVHVHNLIRFLLQEEAVEVCSVENRYGFFKQIVDDIHAIAKFSNNIICNIWYSKSAPGYRNGLRIRIFGSDGSAEWYQMNPEDLIVCDKRGRKNIIHRGSNEVELLNEVRYNRFKAGHPSGFIEAFANLYCDIYDSLYHYINISKHNYLNEYTFGIDDAIKGLVFLNAMHISFKEKKWISIDEELHV